MFKKLRKQSVEYTKTGLVLGFGSNLAKDNSYSQQAISNISKQMPVVANIQGSAMVVDSLKLLDPKRLKKR